MSKWKIQLSQPQYIVFCHFFWQIWATLDTCIQKRHGFIKGGCDHDNNENEDWYFLLVLYDVMLIFQVLNLMISTSSWALPRSPWCSLWSASCTWAGSVAIFYANTLHAPASKIWRSATSTTSTEPTLEAGMGRETMVMVTKFMFPTPTLSTNLMTIGRLTWTLESEIKTRHMVANNHLSHIWYL